MTRSLDFFSLSFRDAAFLKRILKESLSKLPEAEEVLAKEMTTALEAQQKKQSEKVLESINQVTTGLSENQRKFVQEALFAGYAPIFDPYPIVFAPDRRNFITTAEYEVKWEGEGYKFSCPE